MINFRFFPFFYKYPIILTISCKNSNLVAVLEIYNVLYCSMLMKFDTFIFFP